MRILHLLYESEGDYFGIGGVGTRAYEIYERLRDRHDITFLCKKYPGAKGGEKRDLKHLFVGVESKNLTKSLLAYAYHAAQYVRRHEDQYDIIIEEFSPAIPTFLHVFTRKPLVLQIQGYTGKLYFRKYNPLYAFTLYTLELLRPRCYDHFIFVKRETATRFRVGSKKHSHIIPNGVAAELLNMPYNEGEYILYLGRIDIYGKGLDILLNAYAQLLEDSPGVRLVIAGDGRDREPFREKIAALPRDVRNNIELLGWVSGDTKNETIRRALFAVFPSRHEVQSIAALEAMASGKAVIVSDIPEFGVVRDAEAGMSFRTGDARSLAQSMKDMVTHNERGEMGKRGREWVRQFIWDKIALNFERFLNEVAYVSRI
ncbi:MAG TPA: glycosyltransferase family 4 protein [Thermodesulfovibrionales bacterium]|nr:glycosyltransferase family 4 protein [Thermodesulfovibrionales bacterium]